MSEVLAQLFRCPAVGKDLAVRACVRRQGESKAIRAAGGKPIAWELVRAECKDCETGKANAAAAGVTPGPCGLCGAGLVGDEPCSGACAARREEHEAGRVQLRTPPRAPPQDRLWTDEVPDAPLGPPPTPQKPHPFYAPEDEERGLAPTEEDGPLELVEEEPIASHVEVEKQVQQVVQVSPEGAGAAGAAVVVPSAQVDQGLVETAIASVLDVDALPAKALRQLVQRCEAAAEDRRAGLRAAITATRWHPFRFHQHASELPGELRPRHPPVSVEEIIQRSVESVMTDRTCRCGCGLPLRKNNTTGWRGDHNAARYAAGERPERPSRAKENAMAGHPPCAECKSKGRCKKNCTRSKRPAHVFTSGQRADLAGRSIQELLDLRDQVAGELERRRTRAAEELRALDAAVGGQSLAKAG